MQSSDKKPQKTQPLSPNEEWAILPGPRIKNQATQDLEYILYCLLLHSDKEFLFKGEEEGDYLAWFFREGDGPKKNIRAIVQNADFSQIEITREQLDLYVSHHAQEALDAKVAPRLHAAEKIALRRWTSNDYYKNYQAILRYGKFAKTELSGLMTETPIINAQDDLVTICIACHGIARPLVKMSDEKKPQVAVRAEENLSEQIRQSRNKDEKNKNLTVGKGFYAASKNKPSRPKGSAGAYTLIGESSAANARGLSLRDLSIYGRGEEEILYPPNTEFQMIASSQSPEELKGIIEGLFGDLSEEAREELAKAAKDVEWIARPHYSINAETKHKGISPYEELLLGADKIGGPEFEILCYKEDDDEDSELKAEAIKKLDAQLSRHRFNTEIRKICFMLETSNIVLKSKWAPPASSSLWDKFFSSPKPKKPLSPEQRKILQLSANLLNVFKDKKWQHGTLIELSGQYIVSLLDTINSNLDHKSASAVLDKRLLINALEPACLSIRFLFENLEYFDKKIEDKAKVIEIVTQVTTPLVSAISALEQNQAFKSNPDVFLNRILDGLKGSLATTDYYLQKEREAEQSPKPK